MQNYGGAGSQYGGAGRISLYVTLLHQLGCINCFVFKCTLEIIIWVFL